MTYLAHPEHFTRDEFKALVDGLSWDKGWTPQFGTHHNTGVPSLAMWKGWGSTPQERWGENLNRYYAGLGWHAGPHLVVCPDYIWNLCDLRQDGVSVSCWNRLTIGVETLGNYEVGGDDWDSGDGAKVRDNAVWAWSVLHRRLGWNPLTLHFHRECAADHHACPGSNVSKPDLINRIQTQIRQFGSAGPAPVASPAPIGSVKWIQSKVGVTVDGVAGDQTLAAIKGFQITHSLLPDGVVGPLTLAAMEAA